jgi:hypothetical protein
MEMIRRGDEVCVLVVARGYHFVVGFLAVMCLGAIVVPQSELSKSPFISDLSAELLHKALRSPSKSLSTQQEPHTRMPQCALQPMASCAEALPAVQVSKAITALCLWMAVSRPRPQTCAHWFFLRAKHLTPTSQVSSFSLRGAQADRREP